MALPPNVPVINRQIFTKDDLAARVSKATLLKYCDDDRSGDPDKNVVQQIIKDASATVWSYIPTFELDDDTDVPDYLIKLGLDVGQALVYIRFPASSNGRNGFAMMDMARLDLQRLAAGANSLKKGGAPADPGSGGSGSGSTSDTSNASFGSVVSRPTRRNRAI